MIIMFIGVGAAFDSNHLNTSILIESGVNILLDCGFSVMPKLIPYGYDFLDVVFISHQHADHYFGLIPLLRWMSDNKRTKKLVVISNINDAVKRAMELGYPATKLDFVEFKNANKDVIKIEDVEFGFAATIHGVPNIAVRINAGKIICYSGDGKFTKESEELYRNADLLIHEAYGKGRFHSEYDEVVEMAKRNSVKKLALVHMKSKNSFKSNEFVFLPKENDFLKI